jgi:hypothetical protein
MNRLSRMVLLGATALVALSLPVTVIEPAAAIEATVVKSGATPQLARQAHDAAAYKPSKKKRSKKK